MQLKNYFDTTGDLWVYSKYDPYSFNDNITNTEALKCKCKTKLLEDTVA